MSPRATPFAASIRVRRRTDGTAAHDVRYRLNGQSKSTSFDTAEAAERWARIVRQIGPAEALELLTIRVGQTPTVDEYAETYIQSKSGVEGRTLDHYRLYMRVSISPAIGALPLDAVTPSRVAAWINAQTEAGFAAKTIKNRHGFLAAMFEHAVSAGIITKSPCASTRLPESERGEMVFLSRQEFDTLHAYIPPHFQPFVALLAFTGMRFGEATALRPSDFDLTARTVHVSRAWKESDARGYYIGAPKTKRSRRTISLPTFLIPELTPLVESGREWVFVNLAGGPIRQGKFYANTWIPARRLANGQLPFVDKAGNQKAAVQQTAWWKDQTPAEKSIGKWPRVHDLRHSHASWLLNGGLPLLIIQMRLGHESIKTTSDVYGHLAPDMMFAAADALDGYAALTG